MYKHKCHDTALLLCNCTNMKLSETIFNQSINDTTNICMQCFILKGNINYLMDKEKYWLIANIL